MVSINCREFRPQWFFRKKHFTPTNIESTQLARVLGLMELTALGIGATLGAGIYVVTPDATRDFAGPAMCVSFVIAALASLLSGLCYAELGARIPRAGSAYAYSYVAVGELGAFVVGWNMILEYVIGTASVARAAVTYIDVLANDALETFFRAHLPINVPFLGEYVDPVAFSITIFLTGGFMPYGFGGVMTAASAAFYSFVGFDCIATTGEEVANPRRNIPLSVVLSLLVIAVAYFSVSVVFTLDTPYYELTQKTLLPGVPYGSTIVSCGAILCATTSLLGGMFPLPRIVYAMADDGLLFSFLGTVSRRFKTPIVATLLSGLLTAVFASLFEVKQLVDMLSIGTLMAYSLVAASVLVLRYRESFHDILDEDEDDEYLISAQTNYGTEDSEEPENVRIPLKVYLKALFDFTDKSNPKRATAFTSTIANTLACIICACLLVIVLLVTYLVNRNESKAWPIVLIAVFGTVVITLVVRLWRLPQSTKFHSFQVPFAPSLPLAALAVNLYLLVSLNAETWIRFGVWMAIGTVIYLFYSIWASKERERTVASHHSSGSSQILRHSDDVSVNQYQSPKVD